MSDQRDNDPLHGKTLKAVLTELVEKLGWVEMSSRISINCFASDPSINSSLTFLRKTPWARTKLENLYLEVNGYPIPLHRKKLDQEKPVSRAAPQKPTTGPRSRIAAQSVRPPAPKAKSEINVWTGKPFGDNDA